MPASKHHERTQSTRQAVGIVVGIAPIIRDPPFSSRLHSPLALPPHLPPRLVRPPRPPLPRLPHLATNPGPPGAAPTLLARLPFRPPAALAQLVGARDV